MVLKKIWSKPPGMWQDFWIEELERRNDPRIAHYVELELKIIKEINELGYNFYWYGEFSGSTFTKKDNAVVHILIKYLTKIGNDYAPKINYINSLGVKGFYEATEFLIKEYKDSIPPHYNSWNLNFIAQNISEIEDPRYIDIYLEFLQDDKLTTEASYIVEMLGKMKVEKAIPYFIKLLNLENLIDSKFYGKSVEDNKYFVSQTAIKALSMFKNPDHIKYIEKFLEPEKLSWIKFSDAAIKDYKHIYKTTYTEYRKIAEKAIKKMRGDK